MAVDGVPGRAGDAPLSERTPQRVPALEEVVADKAFDGDALRTECLRRDGNRKIPVKANRDPGRWAFDAAGYRGRRRVGRLFGEAKQSRRIATRYEKLTTTYWGLLHLVLGFIRPRITVDTA